jgi:hypothetical protein
MLCSVLKFSFPFHISIELESPAQFATQKRADAKNLIGPSLVDFDSPLVRWSNLLNEVIQQRLLRGARVDGYNR